MKFEISGVDYIIDESSGNENKVVRKDLRVRNGPKVSEGVRSHKEQCEKLGMMIDEERCVKLGEIHR